MHHQSHSGSCGAEGRAARGMEKGATLALTWRWHVRCYGRRLHTRRVRRSPHPRSAAQRWVDKSEPVQAPTLSWPPCTSGRRRALRRCAEFGAAFRAAGALAGSTRLLLARTSALLPPVVSTCGCCALLNTKRTPWTRFRRCARHAFSAPSSMALLTSRQPSPLVESTGPVRQRTGRLACATRSRFSSVRHLSECSFSLFTVYMYIPVHVYGTCYLLMGHQSRSGKHSKHYFITQNTLTTH